MPHVITLLTDFGTEDAYTASMKGVILGIDPSATLVDITHGIPPQDLYAAAFTLGISHPYFPKGTIHVTVVDPGVGTSRQALLLETPEALFLAPDNGVLAYVLEAYKGPPEHRPDVERRDGPPPAVQTPVPAPLRAFALADERLFRSPVSQTFHGRDIFAPVAAHLSRGLAPERVRPPMGVVTTFALPYPQSRRDGTLEGSVLHVDGFGNLITNVRAPDLPRGDLRVTVRGHTIAGLSSSYATGGAVLAILESSGYLEIAARNGNAAQILGAGHWDLVRVQPAETPPPP